MKQHDKDNLKFLLNSTEEEFDAWLCKASDDDIEYAMELIRHGRVENTLKMLEFEDKMVQFMDLDEANDVIEQVKFNVVKKQ